MSQTTTTEKKILLELKQVGKTLESLVKSNKELKKEIDRMKELMNYTPGGIIESKSKKAKK